MFKLSDKTDAGQVLLVVWSVSALIWVVWSRHLALRRPLHARRVRNTRHRPQAWAQGSWLIEGWAQGTLVLGQRVRIKMMRWWGINRWGTMLRESGRQWVTQERRHLVYDMSGWWGDGRWCSGHWRCLVVDHVRSPCDLHGVGKWGWRWRWGPVMLLLRWRHDVVRVGHHPLSCVVMRGHTWRSLREGFAWRGNGVARVILNGHGNEVAMFTCGHSGYAERLRWQSSG